MTRHMPGASNSCVYQGGIDTWAPFADQNMRTQEYRSPAAKLDSKAISRRSRAGHECLRAAARYITPAASSSRTMKWIVIALKAVSELFPVHRPVPAEFARIRGHGMWNI